MIFILMLLRLIGGAAYNSGQRLKNVDQAHLVKASGKLALPKKSSDDIALIGVFRRDMLHPHTAFDCSVAYIVSDVQVCYLTEIILHI